MREYHYLVDHEGRIMHDGTEIVDPATLRFFLRAMKRTPDGRWLVVCQNEHNWFEVPDTPFVVQRLRLERVGNDLRTVEPALLAIFMSRSIRRRSSRRAACSLATSGTGPFVLASAGSRCSSSVRS
jgi:hypothetical protein